MSTGLLRRRTTIDDKPKTPRKAETGEQNGEQLVATVNQWSLPAEAYGAGYLLTGTTLAVLGQTVMDQGATDPSTQLIAWTKYACTFVLSLLLQLLSGRRPPDAASASGSGPATAAAASSDVDGAARKAAWLTAAVGLLDTVSYGLNCLGFALCGSALSMVAFAASGQVFTAVTRRLLLRKTMTTGQSAGVGLVVMGLIVRSSGKIWEALATTTTTTAAPPGGGPAGGGAAAAAAAVAATAAAATDRDMALGVALIVMSAFGYSLLGCLYEWLSAVRGPSMSHAQVATSTSLIGLLATSVFQLAYTRPRWQELVMNRMAARGLGWWPVVRLYGMFGALFTVHGLVQGGVLQRSGATAVGIISALRASAVAVASGVLFCRPQAPQQCLTPASAASAGIVTAGALLWTLTGPRKGSPPAAAAAAAAPSGPPRADGRGTPGSAGRPPEDAADHKYGKHN